MDKDKINFFWLKNIKINYKKASPLDKYIKHKYDVIWRRNDDVII